ncbi:MAG: hypothetical protein P1U82_20695 [Verrucomicrobiales bacterium]|jgi:dipeptidyl aminopeptidase/acylaminoacyl peptidase|nr:hypothetical protein [Verrucomicrobiales bacterium]
MKIPIILVVMLSTTMAAIDYDAEIAPIFRSYCAGCHNEREMEGEFSLETYAGLREGGDKGDPIKPGDAEKSRLIRVIEGHAEPKMPPKDEPQVPAGELATLKAWILEGGKGPSEDQSLFSRLVVPSIPASEAPAPITALAFAPDGKTHARGYFGKVEVFDGNAEAPVLTLNDLPGKINALQFSGEGKTLLLATGITGLKGVAQLYEVATGDLIMEFGGHSDVLYDAEFSPDGSTIATAGYDHVIHLWDTLSGKQQRRLTAHQGAVFDVAFHPNGKSLASASADETVKLWRVADGVRLDTLSQPQGELVSVRFTNDGDHVVAAGADKRLHLWGFVSQKEPGINPVIHSRFAHDTGITALLCMPDGDHLVSAAADRTLKVWSLPDLVELRAEAPLPDTVTGLAAIPHRAAFVAARMDGETQTIALAIGSEEPLKQTTETESTRVVVQGSTEEIRKHTEREPNDTVNVVETFALPAEIAGHIQSPSDVDYFRFSAQAGQSVLIGVNAARSKSMLDSKIAVLELEGDPIEQVRLQATRDSWFTFRGKSSDDSGDFRVHNWGEMELNEYLYANGEVSRLWLYPRGPDSGFKVYPGGGKRHSYFFTSALSHPLGAPCYIVEPLAPDADVVPNGLPVYTLYWENDDDPLRRWGSDSQLWFEVPEDGDYLVRVSDVRGFGGEDDYHYTLTLRDRQPDFVVSVSGKDAKVSPGSGREVRFAVERHEGFDGPIAIEFENLPEGYSMTTPLVIEAEQHEAIGVLWANAGASDPDETADKAVKITATGMVGDQVLTKELGSLGNIQLGPSAKVTVQILPNETSGGVMKTDKPLELTIRPGETISAQVLATRHDFGGRIEFGNEDSGRNLPHGLYVDNIGLNGLLIVEGQTEREFFITAAPWVPAGERLFHLRTKADGGQASRSVLIRVLGRSDAQ